MKKSRFIFIFAILSLVFSTGIMVHAFQTPESIIAAGNVYVSNITYDPGTFFTEDTGTITVFVTNGNSDQSVVVNHVTIGDKDITLLTLPMTPQPTLVPSRSSRLLLLLSHGREMERITRHFP